MDKDIRKLIRNLERQGFEVTRAKTNHYKVRRNGRLVTTLPSTPSDRRSLRNAVAKLKQHGYREE